MCKNEKNNRLNRKYCSFLYQQFFYDSSYDPTKLRSVALRSRIYAFTFSNLECFVDELLSNNETPFVPCLGKRGRKEYRPSPLASQYFGMVPSFIGLVTKLSPRYEYSERVNAFITCCQAMGLQSEGLDWGRFLSGSKKIYPQFGGVSGAELFNTLVKAIRNEWKIKKIQAKVNARKREASERHIDYCDYADALFDSDIYNGCARLVILRLDLGYEKDYADSMSVFDITKDLNHLLENKRCNNALFGSMTGYIAKLEYGVDKGVHWHCTFFFDGSKRKNSSHIQLAEDIGKYWVATVTEGRGAYRNVNDNADHYEKLGRRGIGIINWYETELRNNLKTHVIGYLCKVDQFIRPKWGPKVRLFRRGLYPEMRINKVGRPRKAIESYAGRQFPPKIYVDKSM